MLSSEQLDILSKRYMLAHGRWQQWTGLWQECYDLTLPQHERFYGEENRGATQADRIYDSTAPIALQEFASKAQDGLTPEFSRWARLTPGIADMSAIQKRDLAKQLELITNEVFQAIHRSNFDSQVHETYLDLAIGTGNMVCNEDDDDQLRFVTIPQTQVILDTGPTGKVDGRFRTRSMPIEHIMLEWPKAVLPAQAVQQGQNDRNKKFNIIESTYRDWSAKKTETWHYCVWLENPKESIFTDTYKGQGSLPWVNPRWSVAAGEVYGRGPLLSVLGDVKVTNLIVQMLLEAGEIAITGLWQAESDGILNPETIRLVPGVIIPKAPDSRGLEPVATGSNFDVGQMLLGDLRGNIRRALFDEDLGPPVGTPMSATEVSARMQQIFRRMGSAYGRLEREFVQPLVKRVIYILKKKGRIEIPKIDGREIDIISVSPMASAQAQEDVVRYQKFVGALQGTFGPEVMPLLMNPQTVAQWLMEQYELKPSLLYDEKEKQELLGQIQQMAPQMGGGGGAPPGGAPPGGSPLG
ncbi:MAG: hypothetical protein CME71_11795 [Halobacteriovorax sp.]|nr:hypothetical protein [Halobacteriovorax sp.]